MTLQAFLLHQSPTSPWVTATFQELGPLLESCADVMRRKDTAACLHVAFEPPDVETALASAPLPPGLYVTDAAFHTLPPGFEFGDSVSSAWAGRALHRVTAGPWAALEPTFFKGIVEAVAPLSERDKGVLAARMGFKCKPMTLAEIASDLGVSRQSVSVLQRTIVTVIATAPVWAKLEEKLTGALAYRDKPLTVAELSEQDPWFAGIEDLFNPLEFIFEHLLEARWGLIRKDDAVWVARVTPKRWAECVAQAQREIERWVPERLAEAEVRARVNAILGDHAFELRDEFWKSVSEHAWFVPPEGSERRLVAYGRSADAVVSAILESADAPLHYEEIQRLTACYLPEPMDIRKVHGAASSVGILYKRGHFGLKRHCPLSPEQMESLRGAAEELILQDPSERQWHCSEIREALADLAFDNDHQINDHIIDLALMESTVLTRFKRFIWSRKSENHGGEDRRINLKEAVRTIIEASTKPLKTAEIRAILERERGLSPYFQIFAAYPIVRIADKGWGLIGRDTGISEKALQNFAEILTEVLEKKQLGIHLTEVKEELSAAMGFPAPENLDPQWLVSALPSSDLRLDQCQYYYLSKWGESKRLSISQAVDRIVSELGADERLNLDQILGRVTRVLGRSCSKMAVSSALQSAEGIVFSDDLGLWVRVEIEASHA